MFVKHFCPPLLETSATKMNYVKGAYLVGNGFILTKIVFDLDIVMINLFTKFHLNMCNLCEEN